MLARRSASPRPQGRSATVTRSGTSSSRGNDDGRSFCMRLSGRRLTLVLTTLLVVVLAAGATAAWSFGRQSSSHRPWRSPTTSSRPVRRPDGPAVRRGRRPIHGPTRCNRCCSITSTAINNRDYDAWMRCRRGRAIGTADRGSDGPQDYATTVDSNLAVMAIADAPLRARMMFTSEQAVELAPPSLPVDLHQLGRDVSAQRRGRRPGAQRHRPVRAIHDGLRVTAAEETGFGAAGCCSVVAVAAALMAGCGSTEQAAPPSSGAATGHLRTDGAYIRPDRAGDQRVAARPPADR